MMAKEDKMIMLNHVMELVTQGLESSSSSDCEEDELWNAWLNNPEESPKVDTYINNVENCNDDEFYSQFKIQWKTFHEIKNKFLESDISKKAGSGGIEMIAPRNQLLVFLWFVTNKCVYRDLSNKFKIAISTAHRTVQNVATFLLSLAPNAIKFPDTTKAKQRLADDFREIGGFPQVIGCIGGTYIAIKTPVYKTKSMYVNRHHVSSLTLQAICDAHGKFLDVFTGVSGKIHDARAFKLSPISNELPTIAVGNLFHLLGNSAYPLRPHLLTPYRDCGDLTEHQRTYNVKFSKTRVTIESAFGVLKQRFQQLTHLNCNTVETASKLITAVCVLHNICIDCGDFWQSEETYEGNDDDDALEEGDCRGRRLAEVKRQEICLMLANRKHI